MRITQSNTNKNTTPKNVKSFFWQLLNTQGLSLFI